MPIPNQRICNEFICIRDRHSTTRHIHDLRLLHMHSLQFMQLNAVLRTQVGHCAARQLQTRQLHATVAELLDCTDASPAEQPSSMCKLCRLVRLLASEKTPRCCSSSLLMHRCVRCCPVDGSANTSASSCATGAHQAGAYLRSASSCDPQPRSPPPRDTASCAQQPPLPRVTQPPVLVMPR